MAEGEDEYLIESSGTIEQNMSPPQIDPPKTRSQQSHEGKFSYLCFFILGACILLPWNSLLVSTTYFGYRLKGSPFEFSYMNWVAVVFTFFNVLFLGRATFKQSNSGHTRTILLTLIAMILLSIGLLISTRFEDLGTQSFFAFLILSTFLDALTSATLQNSVIAISSWFGTSHLQGVLSGQGANGAYVSLLQLLAILREFKVDGQSEAGLSPSLDKTSSDALSTVPSSVHISQDKIRDSSFTFYIGATIFCIFALVSFMILSKLPFYKLVIRRNRLPTRTPPTGGYSDGHSTHTEGDHDESFHPLLNSTQEFNQDDSCDLSVTPAPPVKPVALLSVEPKIRSLGIAVFWVFFVTLAVFPSITGSIISTNPYHQSDPTTNGSVLLSHWRNPLIFVSLHFLCFNCGDWFGRVIPQVWTRFSNGLIKRKKVLLMMSMARAGFVPLFLLCNVEKSSVVIFNNDIGTSSWLLPLDLLQEKQQGGSEKAEKQSLTDDHVPQSQFISSSCPYLQSQTVIHLHF